MSTPAEKMNWTAEEHRRKAFELSSEAVNMNRLIRTSSGITEYAAIQTVVMFAQLHATLALSASGLTEATSTVCNVTVQSPTEAAKREGYL